MTILSANTQPDVMGTFIKVVIFFYFIPSMIALVRSPIIKRKFFIVLFINLFFGWSVYGWWIAFIKAFASNQKIIIKNNTTDTITTNKYDQIEKLNELRTSGAITDEEFHVEKSKILNQDGISL